MKQKLYRKNLFLFLNTKHQFLTKPKEVWSDFFHVLFKNVLKKYILRDRNSKKEDKWPALTKYQFPYKWTHHLQKIPVQPCSFFHSFNKKRKKKIWKTKLGHLKLPQEKVNQRNQCEPVEQYCATYSCILWVGNSKKVCVQLHPSYLVDQHLKKEKQKHIITN